MQPFDLLNAPLEGINLIEASAGTGKTYNIEGLFVRLVLEKQLQVDQILVLTFTNAATEELKARIRNKLVQVKNAFAMGGSDTPFIDSLVKRYPDAKAGGLLIHESLIDFDRAAIFTIHGFCQRILHENAFETRNSFDTELIVSQASLLMEVVDDFWRKTFYAAPLELVGFTLDKMNGPEYFCRLLERVKTPDVAIVPDLAEPSLAALQPFRDALDGLKSAWPTSREAVIARLKDPVLNATIYGNLKPIATQSTVTARDVKVTTLVESMDHLTHPENTGFPLFDQFEKFTAAKLIRSTKKNQTPPSHPFFDLCGIVFEQGQHLNDEMAQYLLFLKTRLFAFAAPELRKRKKEKNIQYFDDLLITVKKALMADGSDLLAEGIRQKFKAALVDEFQDTDNIQYDILSRLFAYEKSSMFMIGDPKQAIYSFRGADIFSYMKAARRADARFTLAENWRSRPNLITAVNAIFSGVDTPFVFDEILFKDSKPAEHPATVTPDDAAAFILWYLDAAKFSPDGKPIAKAKAVELVANAVGDEILRLVSTPHPAHPVAPADIAVLVRTNNQAQLIKDILVAKNIPAVLYTTANIFDSPEALEVEKILTAIADPTSISRLKAALATDIMGVTAEDLDFDHVESHRWQIRFARNRKYYELWNQGGFIRMFRQFLALEQIQERLLGLVDGERRLTNVLHLTEILHRQETESSMGITGLLRWLAQQRDPLTHRLEEHQLRLESDEKAVKIVTIHKSKGLEYKVVFCPFAWQSSLLKDPEFTFHDVANDRRLTLDLGSESRRQHIAMAQNENLSENIRLLYVALTRAKVRCYLAWGRINQADTSAPAYLLHGGTGQRAASPTDDQVLLLKEHFAAKTDAEVGQDIRRLCDNSRNIIQMVPLPVSLDSQTDVMLNNGADAPVFCRKFAGNINRRWKISSFSSLVSTEASDVDLPDRDIPLAEVAPDLKIPSDQDGTTIYSFPKGTRAGNFFHDVFEHHDFADENPDNLIALVVRKLQQYGFDPKWQGTVCQTINRVTSIPLRSNLPQLRLSAVEMSDRNNEMEFYFPLNPIAPGNLSRIFKDHGRLGMAAEFPAQLEKLTFAPLTGFMKGYIDMIFEHQGRFYLVDWKSNHLGSAPENYDQTALHTTMQADYYLLQYHIYTLALHQHLRLRQPDYSYGDDFGGVFYIFIRGVDNNRGPEYGIFYDRPDADLIEALGEALIPGYRKE
ncbi:MAG: exodeoxyribonuclease V subunit beta [Desulfobacterales bacterium]